MNEFIDFWGGLEAVEAADGLGVFLKGAAEGGQVRDRIAAGEHDSGDN